MRTNEQKILKTLSELVAKAYDTVVLCPLDEERDFLLDAGKKSEEDFFEACHQIFGMNTDRVYKEVITQVFDYCEFLHETFDHYENPDELWGLIKYADEITSAAEYLSEHAPTDSLGDKAMWWGQAGFARLSCNGLKSKYRVYKKSR